MLLTPTRTQPNQVYEEETPTFIYREQDNSKIYGCNEIANKTIIVRLWFNDSTLTEEFETVFENSEVKIIKVK